MVREAACKCRTGAGRRITRLMAETSRSEISRSCPYCHLLSVTTRTHYTHPSQRGGDTRRTLTTLPVLGGFPLNGIARSTIRKR